MTRTSIATSLVGLVCFAAVAVYFAVHPDHTWHEATGEPESVPVDIEVEPVRPE